MTGPRDAEADRADSYHLRSSGADWWLIPAGDGWTVAYRLVGQGTQPVVAELRLVPSSPVESMTDAAWQPVVGDVPIGGLPASVLKGLSIRTPFTGRSHNAIKNIRAELGVSFADRLGITGHKRTRGSETDRLRAQVAAMYSVAVLKRRDVNSVVAEALGPFTAAQVRDLVYDARTSGFLSAAPGKRRAGGSLTPAGRALLTDAEYQSAVRSVDRVIDKRSKPSTTTRRKK